MFRNQLSEASIGKLLFSNAYQLIDNLGLTAPGGDEVARARLALFNELRDLNRRLSQLRELSLSRYRDRAGRSLGFAERA